MSTTPRILRHRFACLVLCGIVCALSAPSAFGEGFRGRGMARGAQAEARGARQAERAQQRAALRGAPLREGREGSPQPRIVEPPMQPVGPPVQAAEPTRPGRLSPEERRALRQQINEAGRDVYRPNTRPYGRP